MYANRSFFSMNDGDVGADHRVCPNVAANHRVCPNDRTTMPFRAPVPKVVTVLKVLKDQKTTTTPAKKMAGSEKLLMYKGGYSVRKWAMTL